MRSTLTFLAAGAVLALMITGCTGPEQKFGRGMRDSTEIVRLGEMDRSQEQMVLLDGPDVGYTTGFIHGLNKTLARTGIGIYEMVTAPIPPYGPVCTNYLSPNPVYPDSYKPGLSANPVYSTDTSVGFTGGDELPWFPGSRFNVFDN